MTSTVAQRLGSAKGCVHCWNDLNSFQKVSTMSGRRRGGIGRRHGGIGRRRGGIGRSSGSIAGISSRSCAGSPRRLRRHGFVWWGRQFLTERTEVGALSVSDRHAMSARNWRHMHMSPTCRQHSWLRFQTWQEYSTKAYDEL